MLTATAATRMAAILLTMAVTPDTTMVAVTAIGIGAIAILRIAILHVYHGIVGAIIAILTIIAQPIVIILPATIIAQTRAIRKTMTTTKMTIKLTEQAIIET